MKSTAAKTPPRYHVLCLGTADGSPNAHRNHAAFLCRLGRTVVLLDCGEATDRAYKAAGLGYNLVDAIFLSHMHADHFGGLFMLLQGFWLESRRKPLPIYLPEPAIRPLREMLQAAFLFHELLPFSFSLCPLTPAAPIMIGQVRLTPFPTSHLAGLQARFGARRPRQFQAYSFLVESTHRRLAYSGDLGAPEDLARVLTEPLDLLICELAHFHPQALFDYLRGRAIEQAAWVHLGPEQRRHALPLSRLAQKTLPEIAHSFPNDGTIIAL